MITYEYIAGFFDGEGSIIQKGKNSWVISVPNTNRMVLEKIFGRTLIGTIYNGKIRNKRWKKCYYYRITNRKDVLKFLENISNFLIIKRDKVNDTIFKIIISLKKDEINKQEKIKKIEQARKLYKELKSLRAVGRKMGGLHPQTVKRLINIDHNI